jgi:acetylornithine aminotransferase
MSSPLVSTYKRLDVAFTHGEGVRLFDEAGRGYLDALSGIAVCCLGHAHPRVTAAITAQAGRVIHTSNLYRIPTQERLAEALLRHCALESVFFCNSGAEANEAAIKVARAYGHRREVEVPAIVVAQP